MWVRGIMRCIVFTLAIAVVLTASFYTCQPVYADASEYEKIAENNSFVLYVNDKNLAVVLEEKETGKKLYGVCETDESTANTSWKGFLESGFGVEFYNERTPMPERLDAVNGKPYISVSRTNGGFDADISYKDKGISFSIEVRLTNDGFSAHVPSESITEGADVRLGALYIYPFLGASRLGEKAGFMLIPEGAGAIIDLKNNNGKYKAPYTKRIYGENRGTQRQSTSLYGKYPPKEAVKILSPFYGIAHTEDNTAFFATIREGQYNAEILAYPNGVITEFNWITAKFILREQYNMQTTRTKAILTSEKEPYFRDITVDFAMLTNDAADYMGMAEKYRENILAEGIITQKDTSFLTRLDFFGADAMPWMISHKSAAATTISQMDDMLLDLSKAGVADVLAVYKGWQNGGITKNYGSGDFKVDGKLGSKKELQKAAQNMESRGNTFLLYQDLLKANPNRLYNTNSNIAKGISQVIMEVLTFSYPFDSLYYLTPKKSIELAQKFNKEFGAEQNIGIAVGSVTNTLFSYYSQNSVKSRGEAAEGFFSAVNSLEFSNKALEQPFDYMWSEMDYFFDMPLHSSNYSFISAEIPFIPIALKGVVPFFAEYVNFEPNEKEFFLKMVEYGAYPSFILTHENPSVLRETNSSYIYSSEYHVYKEQVINYTTELRKLYEATENSKIVNHETLKKGCVKIVYGNGTEIIINYNDTAFSYKGNNIAAKSYIVMSVGGEA